MPIPLPDTCSAARRAMEGTGIDDPHAAFAIVVALVGVAVEEVVVGGVGESIAEGAFVAVKDGDVPVFEFDFNG